MSDEFRVATTDDWMSRFPNCRHAILLFERAQKVAHLLDGLADRAQRGESLVDMVRANINSMDRFILSIKDDDERRACIVCQQEMNHPEFAQYLTLRLGMI